MFTHSRPRAPRAAAAAAPAASNPRRHGHGRRAPGQPDKAARPPLGAAAARRHHVRSSPCSGAGRGGRAGPRPHVTANGRAVACVATHRHSVEQPSMLPSLGPRLVTRTPALSGCPGAASHMSGTPAPDSKRRSTHRRSPSALGCWAQPTLTSGSVAVLVLVARALRTARGAEAELGE